MAHIIIEYSSNVAAHHDTAALLDVVHEAVGQNEPGGFGGLRTRGVERSNYKVGDGDSSYAFVAVIGRVGPGRSDEEKMAIVELLVDTVESALADSPLFIAFSAEVQEIDAVFRINRNQVKSHLGQKS